MTDRKYKVAGFSNQNGIFKMRFSQDLANRVKTLEKNGHTDIDLRELPEPMTKLEAARYFKENISIENPQILSVVDSMIEREESRPKRDFKRDNTETQSESENTGLNIKIIDHPVFEVDGALFASDASTSSQKKFEKMAEQVSEFSPFGDEGISF